MTGLMCIKDMDEDMLRVADMPFSTPSAAGNEVTLTTKHTRITPDNRNEYVRLALNYRWGYHCLINWGVHYRKQV